MQEARLVKPSDAAAADDATTALLMMPPPDHDENSGGGVDFDASGNSQKPWRMTYLGQYGPIIECHRTREEAVQAYMGFKIAEQHAGDAPQYDVVVRREEMRRRTSPNDLASSAHSQERRQVVQREDKPHDVATLAARPCVIQSNACESYSGRRAAVRARVRPIRPNRPVQVELQLEMERHDHDLHKSKGSPDTT